MDQRFEQLKAWLTEVLPQQPGFSAVSWDVVPVSGDASFRRYFRALSNGCSWIAVDAPPEKEDSRPFVAVAQALAQHEVAVPEIHATDLDQGFMLLSDLGDDLYLGHLTQHSVDALYQQALQSLLLIQACPGLLQGELPPYDAALLNREMELFREWFLPGLLGLELSDTENTMLDALFVTLTEAALQQPQVFVHRDYHSRNLMYRPEQAPGVIDFQDAVFGPVTYDLVSLLRDCYVAWPHEQVYGWVEDFRQRILAHGQPVADAFEFRRWFDLMGAQRHLKVLGIFARLKLRDGKSGYLADIPRTLFYLLHELSVEPALQDVTAWLHQVVIPAMQRSGIWPAEELERWLVA
ncbi:phosphotransferase [Neptuniibacter sp. CAU 1671]|uniref:aminoglycoside phosphotransferase family protein n=1 Tax=Neptuniibacter sp. CAU 1671 TaxID=3032593 RepID=UPI0023DA2015|nr:phosphotransferase [Neptuniibacter sp. CAU 1671]MDF2181437.1 phosphotransferase [Neptuniibacter sp. CAU 1671]